MSTHICTNFNQSQKGSRQDLRESQTQVVWSTSFKYKKLQSAPSVSPLPVPPKEHSCLDKRDSKHLPPPEKTGPKTLPKPHAGVFTPRPSAQMASLPTPTPFPAPMPAPLPGGLPLTRICGRKRLTWDQRKKSFSEPKCMNEIGLTHAESTALLRRAGDTSVAIHRRMFEQVSQGLVGRVSVVVGEALEQDARLRLDSKCNQRKGCSQRRPQSAVLQPLHSPADLSPLSLVTSSSRLSLQGCAQEPQLFSGKEDLSSPLASGGDCNTPCYTVIYPGRVTAPRAPALQLPKVAEGPSAADVVSPPLLAHSRTREPHLVPVPRKKRARRSDHSTLAASVGLPCPLSDAARHLSILPPPGQ
ncbi:protein Shroom3-like [Periophthalmus magnuspinnatus]|uniref:protein Shroom3-like n=1 Tax=Periophthalmus magnuspinnatus TaxID=409849 RepID=UPI002436D217|nr:protein Shroom3-like [Periophthalmus magnuspinnatus]